MSHAPRGRFVRGPAGRPRRDLDPPHETAAAPVASPPYEGLVTRTFAFAIDAAIIDLVAIVVVAIVALVLSVFTIAGEVKKVLAVTGGALFIVWSVAYFVTFWSTTGQTPGNRLLRIRVCRARDGGVLRPRTALLRFAALIVAAIPLFAGLLLILTDGRRRGLHDILAGSVVVSAPIQAEAASPPHPITSRRT
jgi:uncharacterized RDD family membrane protein YckC